MGAILSSCWDHLPPLMDILLPTPDVYLTLLNIFQYFPLFTIIQWLTAWHPAGKTSMKSSLFNLPGRWAWFAMEIVSPVNLLYVLWKLPLKLADAHRTTTTTTTNFGSNANANGSISISIPLPNKLLAALFVAHYLNRAVISPFLAAPSMSPIHLFIMVSAMLFNWFNSTCLAGWLVGYDPVSPYHPSSPPPNTAAAAGKIIPSLGLALFLAGMAGNIYAERTLFRLRREEGARRAAAAAADAGGGGGGGAAAASSKDPSPSPSPSSSSSSNSKPSSPPSTSTSKVYVIPPPSTPLFASILYPHYVCEWLEWTGFALAGTAVRSSAEAGMLGLRLGLRSYNNPITTTATAGTVAAAAAASGPLHLAPWLRPAAQLAAAVGLPFPVPAAVFVVNAVTNMLPHARWGRRWYVERFGEEKVAGRGAVVPFCGWF
ncbi:3-oxo-5-alpha-steroid 4-dehydrogenase family protein [Aspergillus aculeatinus CBS 121060]|uniref:Uncharacterized protein n=1 Tax=Aspergillus aculeatinus CBS 121060 TaxID=1448322 RepID=A0ACD1HLF3_9EURO|nr:hypothetical protein BO66DRAFT_468133 [Aspergillus aculeatinus CBS 121060]RAH74297.1 hypothetical protein BO66DRAFT_468133 [Aspergillus aculeatinus CBS 121060]